MRTSGDQFERFHSTQGAGGRRDRHYRAAGRDESGQGLGSLRGLGASAAREYPCVEETFPYDAKVADIALPRPLAETDECALFACGRESMSHWLRQHGWTKHAAGVSRANVICDAATNRIVGYVSLSAAQIARSTPPRSHGPNMPDPLPATLLDQLAVHRDFQGRGYARSLLLLALRTSLRASQAVASWGVITHSLDDPVREFYARHGFQDVPFDPHRAMVARMADLKKSGFGAG